MHSYGVWKITRPDRGTWHKIVWMWNSLPVQYLQVSACGRTVVCYQCWHWFARVRLEIFPGWTNKHSHSQHYQIVLSFQIRVAHYIMMIKLFAHFYNRRVLFKMNDDCEPFLLIALESNIHHHTCLFLAQKLTKEIFKANLI